MQCGESPSQVERSHPIWIMDLTQPSGRYDLHGKILFCDRVSFGSVAIFGVCPEMSRALPYCVLTIPVYGRSKLMIMDRLRAS
jgi:hypothetical protein